MKLNRVIGYLSSIWVICDNGDGWGGSTVKSFSFVAIKSLHTEYSLYRFSSCWIINEYMFKVLKFTFWIADSLSFNYVIWLSL